MTSHSPLLFLAAALAAAYAQPPAGGRGGANLPEPLREAAALVRQGKLDAGANAYFAFLKENPGSVPAHAGLANTLDLLGQGTAARLHFQKALDLAATPAAKAQAQRAMAMSFAFENDCKNTVKWLEQVYQYQVSVGDAYQQGEMLNEAARVCIEAGSLDTAALLYRRGTEAGLKEKDIKPERVALWNFRLEHALARIAARRKQAAEAARHVAAARKLLDGNPEMAKQQEIFYPYLTGYVALHLGDAEKALQELAKANQGDPFIQLLQALAHEKLGHQAEADALFTKAGSTTGHNPPAAFARYYTRTRNGARRP